MKRIQEFTAAILVFICQWALEVNKQGLNLSFVLKLGCFFSLNFPEYGIN